MKMKLLGIAGYACIYAALFGLVIWDRIPKPMKPAK